MMHQLQNTYRNGKLSGHVATKIRRTVPIIIGLMLAIPVSTPAFAASFECPAIGDLPTTALEAKIDTLLPIGKVLGQPAELYEAAALLRDHGMTDANAVNHLVALYCPTVAEDTSLSDAEKTDRMRRFAAEAIQVVSQQGETEEITYTIRLEPTLAERLEDDAAAAGTSVEDWIKKIVTDTTK